MFTDDVKFYKGIASPDDMALLEDDLNALVCSIDAI